MFKGMCFNDIKSNRDIHSTAVYCNMTRRRSADGRVALRRFKNTQEAVVTIHDLLVSLTSSLFRTQLAHAKPSATSGNAAASFVVTVINLGLTNTSPTPISKTDPSDGEAD